MDKANRMFVILAAVLIMASVGLVALTNARMRNRPIYPKKLKEYLPEEAENVIRLNYRYYKFSIDGDCFLLGREARQIRVKSCYNSEESNI